MEYQADTQDDQSLPHSISHHFQAVAKNNQEIILLLLKSNYT